MQIKLTLEYDGTAYHGWQVQPDGETLQAVLERAAAHLLGEAVRLAAAGRTDAGVHAAGQVACFRTDRRVDPAVVRRALNALTPDDIAVLAAEEVPDDFDARRSAVTRRYTYRIWNAPTASVFWRRYAWHIARPLDERAMAAGAAHLLGEHDFRSFQAAGCDSPHAVRRVLRSEVVRDGSLITYTIVANAFVRHMVRNIVGSLVEVGCGRRTPEAIAGLLALRDRTMAGATAPSHGLCLASVEYPPRLPSDIPEEAARLRKPRP